MKKSKQFVKKILQGFTMATLAHTAFAHAEGLNVNQNGTLVELCAQAAQEVEQDAANVSVSFKSENRDKRIAADEVNKTMAAVIAKIKTEYPKIKIDNQSYKTYQQYTQKGQSKDWTVEQSFTLESKSPKEVPGLVSMIQEAGVTVNGMSAFLTPQTARAAQEKLYQSAFDDVQLRLNAIATAMGVVNKWQIVHIDTTGQRGCGGGQQMPMMAYAKGGLARDAVEVAPPVFETGKQMVQLSLWVAAKMK